MKRPARLNARARFELKMERAWLIVATLCLIVAAIFLWRAQDNELYFNAAFVAAALGVVAWFLRVRTQLRQNLPPDARSPQEDDPEETEETEGTE
jgi:hypothetical protein